MKMKVPLAVVAIPVYRTLCRLKDINLMSQGFLCQMNTSF